MTIEERFWRKVRKTDNCWEWESSKDRQGYGYFSEKGRTIRSHKMAYVLCIGPIPIDTCVCHKCDNPSCVNPSHLFLGTKRDNTRDCRAKGRNAFGERHGEHKLTDIQVREIRASTESGSVLGRRYGITRQYASQLKRGAWRKSA